MSHGVKRRRLSPRSAAQLCMDGASCTPTNTSPSGPAARLSGSAAHAGTRDARASPMQYAMEQSSAYVTEPCASHAASASGARWAWSTISLATPRTCLEQTAATIGSQSTRLSAEARPSMDRLSRPRTDEAELSVMTYNAVGMFASHSSTAGRVPHKTMCRVSATGRRWASAAMNRTGHSLAAGGRMCGLGTSTVTSSSETAERCSKHCIGASAADSHVVQNAADRYTVHGTTRRVTCRQPASATR